MSLEIGKTLEADVIGTEQEEDRLILREEEEKLGWSPSVRLFIQQILPSLSIALVESNKVLVGTFGYRLMDRVGTVHDINGFAFWNIIVWNLASPFLIGVQEKTNFTSAFYVGEGSKHLVRRCLLHGLLVTVLKLTIIYFVFIPYRTSIVALLGYEPEVGIYAEKYFPLFFYAFAIGHFRQLIVLYSVSQSQVSSNAYGLIAVISMVTTIALMNYLELSLKLGIMSFMYARMYNEIFFLVFVIIYAYNNNKVGPFTLEDFKNATSGIVSFYIDSMSFASALEVEYLGNSIQVVMCVQLKKPIQTTAFNVFLHFSNFLLYFGSGFSVTARTEINKHIGMKEMIKAKNIFYTYIVGLVLLSYIFGITIYFFRSMITAFYTSKHPELNSTMIQLISIYTLCLICSSTFYNFSLSIARMKKQLTLLMSLQIIVMIILQSTIQYFIVHQLNKQYDIGASHLMICFNVLHMMLLSILLIRLSTLKW